MEKKTDRKPINHLYRRLSVEEADTGSCGLDWQQNIIAAWSQLQPPCGTVGYCDDGISAGKPLHKRPAGRLLVAEAVKTGDRIVVARLDRLFRDVLDFRRRVEGWHAAGVNVVSCTEMIDLRTPQGMFFGTLIIAFAELERAAISGRVQAAVATRRAKGLRIAALPLYGWRHVPGPVKPDGERDTVLEPDPEEQEVIRLMRLWRSHGHSLRHIAETLTSNGYPPRRGHHEWSHSTVADIIKSADSRQIGEKKPHRIDQDERGQTEAGNDTPQKEVQG